MKISYEEFKNRLNKKLILIDKYINYSTKINFKCPKCNNIWNTSPRNAVIYNCPYCQKKIKKDSNYFRKELKNVN